MSLYSMLDVGDEIDARTGRQLQAPGNSLA